MGSLLFQVLSHRASWVAIAAGMAGMVAARRARRRWQSYQRIALEDDDDDLRVLWAELEALRADERLFERFRRTVRARLGVDVRRLLPGDRVGQALETGRVLRRLIDDLEGEFDCALPPCTTTERLTLRDWICIVARNAARSRSGGSEGPEGGRS